MSEIFFREQRNGYDKNQVDNYIQRITEAYQTAYKEYLAVCDKYNNLLLDFQKLESERQTRTESAFITKALTDSERLAQQIINNAYKEEAKIVEQTKKNLDYVYRTISQAMDEAQNFLNSRISERSGGIINENKSVV